MRDYGDKLQKILRDACPDIGGRQALSFKNVFGAVAGYIDGKIFCSCGHFGFALKLPEAERNLLFREGARPLRYFPKGHVKKDYAVLTDPMMDDSGRLCHFVETSIKFTTQPHGDGR